MDSYQDKIEDAGIKADMQRDLTADDLTPVEFLSQCLSYADEKGYRDRWNSYTFKAKFDRDPSDAEITQAIDLEMDVTQEFITWLHRYWAESKKQEKKQKKEGAKNRLQLLKVEDAAVLMGTLYGEEKSREIARAILSGQE